MSEHHRTSLEAAPRPSAAAQQFAETFFKDTMDLVKTLGDETDQIRVKTAIQARREELEAAVRHEHGAEADAILAEGYELAQKLMGIIERYWKGELA